MSVLTPVHTRVTGRARFVVSGLKRAPAFKDRLEHQLAQTPGITGCTVSALTGRILVFYDPCLTTGRLRQTLETVIENTGPDRRSGPAETSPLHSDHPPLNGDQNPSRTRRFVHSVQEIGRRARSGAADIIWHTRSAAETARRLNTDIHQGLSRDRIPALMAQYGDNSLPKTQSRSGIQIFLGQMNSLPVYLLGGVAGISIVMGGLLDAVIVAGVVVANAAIGYITEHRAEKNIDALNDLVHHMAEVIRDGRSLFVPAEAVVPGDLLVLKPGAFVPADSRIIQASRLTIDESLLTGESLPVEKQADPLYAADLPIGDRKNMAYMGTCITGGQGLAVVVATGSRTEIGQLKALLNDTRSMPSPIERQLDTIGDQLIYGCLAVCGGVFAMGLVMGFGVLNMLRMSISLAAAAVPEGLPSIATVNFALGISRMEKNDVLVRRLPAAETLGAIQTICLDKTGTITLNRMKAVSIYTDDTWISVTDGRLTRPGKDDVPTDLPELEKLYQVCALCCETRINGRCSDGRLDISGSATESALTELVDMAGIDVKALRKSAPLIRISHRSETQLFMSTLHHTDLEGEQRLLVKGSPLEILSRCTSRMINGQTIPLSDTARSRIEAANKAMADKALRVLGFACRTIRTGTESHRQDLETDLTWLGLIGLADPPRNGIKSLIAQFHRAGIRTVMITGDQPLSARAVAEQLDLSRGEPLEIMDARELAALDDESLIRKAGTVHVYARVTPSQKLKIVKAIQAAGQTVAMTGDGINDGPALKAADIGIAMGGSGTDLARDVADVVLTKDSLALLATSLADGRSIYQNIRKSVHYSLSTNISEIQLMASAIALGLGSPLNVMQLLWINMISDILPGLALSLEKPEGDVMETVPRNGDDPLFNSRDFSAMLRESTTITGGALGSLLYGLARYGSPAMAGGLAFQSLAVGQLLHALTCRSETAGLFTRKKLVPNRPLNWAIGCSLATQALTLVFPPLRSLLGLSSIRLVDGLVITAGATAPLLINEVIKAAGETSGPDSEPQENDRTDTSRHFASTAPETTDDPVWVHADTNIWQFCD